MAGYKHLEVTCNSCGCLYDVGFNETDAECPECGKETTTDEVENKS